MTGQIYTDHKAGEKIKAQAQGLITLATYGIGMFIGSLIAGKVKDMYTTQGDAAMAITNWLKVWYVPAGIAAVVLLLFLLFFKDRKAEPVSV